MINAIVKYPNAPLGQYSFTVLIPTWNNLPILQLCLRSIQQNSALPLQLIVIVNEGADGTLEWLKKQEHIDIVHAPSNIGICYALNICRSLIQSDYVLYLNDDMYVLPGWDIGLAEEIHAIGHKSFMISATMIEPVDTRNDCVRVGNYGNSLENFREAELLKEFHQYKGRDWSGSTWPPNVMHRDLWDLVGGMSIEFSPGMYSDPDLSMKLVTAGVRTFKGVGSSLVYHFGSKSTGRIRKNPGRDRFLMKWGMTPAVFLREFLHRGAAYSGDIQINELKISTRWSNTLKKIKTIFS